MVRPQRQSKWKRRKNSRVTEVLEGTKKGKRDARIATEKIVALAKTNRKEDGVIRRSVIP
jgi:hypothetical protein